MIERGVKLLAVDFATPDLAIKRRERDFSGPVHHALLGHGVLICENLTNHDEFVGERAEAMFLPINVVGADGAPARVVARHARYR